MSSVIDNFSGSRKAVLHCVGRDIENQEIALVFENSRWTVTDEIKEIEPDLFSFAVHDFMLERKYFKGSATELANELSKTLCKEIFSNCIKKELMHHAYELQSYGVTFESKRSNGQRIIILKYDLKSDSSAAKKLKPDVCKNADTAVTETDTRCSEKPLNTLFDCIDENKRTAKTVVPVGENAVLTFSGADPVNLENACDVKLMSLDEVLNMSANKIRNQLASQEIKVPPLEFKN